MTRPTTTPADVQAMLADAADHLRRASSALAAVPFVQGDRAREAVVIAHAAVADAIAALQVARDT